MSKITIEFLENPIDIILMIVAIFPILKGIFTSFSSNDLKNQVEDFWSNIAFLIGIILGANITKNIYIMKLEGIYSVIYEKTPRAILSFIEERPITIYIIIMPIIIFICYIIIDIILKLINSFTVYLVLDGIQMFLKKKGEATKRFAGALFQIPTTICLILIFVVALNLGVYFKVNDKFTKAVEKSKIYNYVNSKVVYPISQTELVQKIPIIINNSFKIRVEESNEVSGNKKVIVYYNGITLEEGVRSNDEIDTFAKKLANKYDNSVDKSKAIYEWIGSNIEYDYDKAEKILRNEFNVESGTVNTFYTREGVCFDYACLFATMSIANDIKVRIITGDGKSDGKWVSHAWNQIYDPVKNQWINVDPTFYKGGNYFDSPLFNLDHRGAEIAGEW
ncbi:transglutaminase-like domain-containing protein [Clostridium sediminicola]|uniref:transglutaminase domain-containing protein n=1 Tax=Clostridium sediminicola TaxID=3114879 RepID=UPI0031F26C21